MKLTEEQKSIIELVVQGKTNAQIAEEMGYCERNVKKKLHKIYKTFKVENRAALITTYLSMKFAEYI